MKPQDRIKRYAQLALLATIIVWALLCYFIAISPRAKNLQRVDADLAESSAELKEMRKEIENASIAGTPAPGESRYEKFGILGVDEEQLFLSDLIDFCKETNNSLNVVRRSNIARAAKTTSKQDAKKKQSRPSTEPDVPQPVIKRVPHTVNYSGTFLSSFYLLRKLESYKRLLTVERVEIASDTRVGYPRVNGNITIELYLVHNPGQPPAVGVEVGAETKGQVAPSAANEAPTEEHQSEV